MGTRHLICVVHGGEYKIAQYGQWDGYPEGQGSAVLAFLTKLTAENRVQEFKEKLNLLHWMDAEESKREWTECGADPNSDFVSYEIADLHKKRYPQNSRDAGADILDIVLKNDNPIGLVNSYSFAGDSLFCEYAYVIDLDRNMFEVYIGFNKEPVAENQRFYDTRQEGDEYLPVKFFKDFPLDHLPTQDEFLACFAKAEEE